MSRVTEAGMDRAQEDIQRTEQRAVGEREVRWSARRKEGVVMRPLRGASLGLLARETGQPAGRISAWREEFPAAGREGLKARPLPTLLSRRALPGRDRLPGDRALIGLPLRARDQRLRGEVHPDAQGAAAMDRALCHLRGARGRRAEVHRHLRPRVATGMSRLPHADRSTRAPTQSSARGVISLLTRVSDAPRVGHRR
jgi:hypothetical protein